MAVFEKVAAVAHSMTNSTDGKDTYYAFGGSVWSATGLFAMEQTGQRSKYNVVQKNVLQAENLQPEYLKIQPSGTVPCLVPAANAPVKHTTIDCLNYILTKAGVDSKLIATQESTFFKRLQSNETNPNIQLFSAISDEELAAKAGSNGEKGVPHQLLSAQIDYMTEQVAIIERNPAIAIPAVLEVYKTRLAGYQSNQLQSIYAHAHDKNLTESDRKQREKFFADSRTGWDNTAAFLNQKEVGAMWQAGCPWLSGTSELSSDDYAFAVWLCRMVHLCGGDASEEGLQKFQNRLGSDEKSKIHPNIVAYWKALINLKSFKTMYSEGCLH